MLSAEAYSFRQKSRLAISLSWIAGYTNIVALLATGHVISHMTGNTTIFSSSLISANWTVTGGYACILGSFITGAAISGFMTEGARRRGAASKYILPLATEACLLGLLGLVLPDVQSPMHSTMTIYAIASLAAMAMGLQNATITRISGAEIRTTHVTGVVTDLGLEGAQFLLWYRDKMRWRKGIRRLGRTFRITQRHPTFLRLLLLGSILGSFVFGVMVGTLLLEHWAGIVMIPPVVFLLGIILIDWRHPIADVRELDLLSDPELKMHGILKEMLPRELGIYRISYHRPGKRAPDFRAWADRIPRHWRVIVLALSPITMLNDNAVLNLLAAADGLQERGKLLILASLTQRQFNAISQQDGIDRLGAENIVPDLEFAIARALGVMREQETTLSEHSL